MSCAACDAPVPERVRVIEAGEAGRGRGRAMAAAGVAMGAERRTQGGSERTSAVFSSTVGPIAMSVRQSLIATHSRSTSAPYARCGELFASTPFAFGLFSRFPNPPSADELGSAPTVGGGSGALAAPSMSCDGLMTFPRDFDILAPVSHAYGAPGACAELPSWVATLVSSEDWNQPRCWSDPSRYMSAPPSPVALPPPPSTTALPSPAALLIAPPPPAASPALIGHGPCCLRAFIAAQEHPESNQTSSVSVPRAHWSAW
eukprot:scaffold13357_cov100-Isochrysis_galbana.AAC.3